MSRLETTLRITRVLETISFVAILGLVVTFVAEIKSINANPPGYIFVYIVFTSIAAVYCLITSVVIPGRSTRVWFIFLCTIVDGLFLVALIIGAVVIGRPLSYLHCTGVPSIVTLGRRGDSSPDATAALILVTRLNQYLTHVNADVGYGETIWDGVSGSKNTCLEAKAVWGCGIGLCLLFFCSTICCGCIWRRQKRSTAGLQKLDG